MADVQTARGGLKHCIKKCPSKFARRKVCPPSTDESSSDNEQVSWRRKVFRKKRNLSEKNGNDTSLTTEPTSSTADDTGSTSSEYSSCSETDSSCYCTSVSSYSSEEDSQSSYDSTDSSSVLSLCREYHGNHYHSSADSSPDESSIDSY